MRCLEVFTAKEISDKNPEIYRLTPSANTRARRNQQQAQEKNSCSHISQAGPLRVAERLFVLLGAFVGSLRPFTERLTNLMGNDKDHEAGCHSPYPVQMPICFSHVLLFLSASGRLRKSYRRAAEWSQSANNRRLTMVIPTLSHLLFQTRV